MSLEKTNEGYAIAKITGIKMCEAYRKQFGRDYRSVMPTNLYGPNDNFHEVENSACNSWLIRRFHDSKLQKKKKEIVKIWGTGAPKREFLHVDDMAKGCIKMMNLDSQIFYRDEDLYSHVNLGSGSKDIEIRELANIISKVVGFKGQISFDISNLDGTLERFSM